MNTHSSVSTMPRVMPACVGVEEASRILGWPVHFFPILMKTGHLKPLGKPKQNARKWFATVELERLGREPEWLDKAIRIVSKHVQDMNEKQKGRILEEVPAHLN